MASFDYYEHKKKFAMLESDYPYTSGAEGNDSTDCLYSASKTTNVTVKSSKYLNGTYLVTLN